LDEEVEKFRENLQRGGGTWSREEKIELEYESDKLSDSTLKNVGSTWKDLEPYKIDDSLKDYVDGDYKIIGFDESSNTRSWTYSKLASFKFGECQLSFKDGKYHKELIMYKPILTYIEDNKHKLIIYKTVIKKFIKTIKNQFYIGSLKNPIDDLVDWFEKTYVKKIDGYIDAYNYYQPSLGHVVDRIRTADEALKSLIRIKEESKLGKVKNLIFLGDGIQMFRQHIFPPSAFTNFFYEFIKKYNINYFAFSKQSRLRDAQGNFLLPTMSQRVFKKEKFLVELPDLSKYTKSKTYYVRIVEGTPALRFDVPDFSTINDAMTILRNLIPYSPHGYPLCLEEAHNASTLLPSEKNKLEAKFYELQIDEKTKIYAQNYRQKIIPP